MADQELNVKIKAIDEATVVLNGVQKSTQKLTDELQREKKALLGVDKQSKSARQSLKKFGKDTKALGQKVSGTINRVSSLKNAMMGLAAVGAIKWAIGAIKEAAAFEGQLASLGPNMEATEERMKKLQKATGNIFSIRTLVDAEAKMRSLGVELKLTPTLLKNVAAKASSMGITTERALDSVATGVSRQSNKWLDNLGILISVEKANRDYAASLGDVNKELTEQEKKMAFTVAVQKELEKSTSEMPDALLNVMEMTAAWEDSILDLKRALLELAPAFVVAIRAFSDFVKALEKHHKSVKSTLTMIIDPMGLFFKRGINTSGLFEQRQLDGIKLGGRAYERIRGDPY